MSIQIYDLSLKNNVRISPFCWRVKLFLKAKGLDFETVPVGFTDKHLLEPFGTARVPVMVDGPSVVADSMAIMLDLEERYPAKKLISNPNELKFFAYWIESSLYAHAVPFILKSIYDFAEDRDRDYFRATREQVFGKSLEEIHAGRDAQPELFAKAVTPLRRVLAASDFIGGSEPRGADLVAFSFFMWIWCSCPEDILEDLEDDVAKWRGRMMEAYDGYGGKASRVG